MNITVENEIELQIRKPTKKAQHLLSPISTTYFWKLIKRLQSTWYSIQCFKQFVLYLVLDDSEREKCIDRRSRARKRGHD